MKYRKLNEVLIEWGESSFEDSNNTFINQKDIKKFLEKKYFIYRLEEKDQIKIFDEDWPEFKEYRDKVWINSKHVELNGRGWTVDEFEPGEYRVYIEDIDKVTHMTCMFYDCGRLVSAFIPNSVTSIGWSAFYGCRDLKTVYVEDINKFNQIEFENKWSDPRCYGAKVIELKK